MKTLRNFVLAWLVLLSTTVGVISQTQFPNGVSSYGIPLFGTNETQIPNMNGKVFFVDDVRGSDGYSCLSPQNPCLTIQKAHDLAGDENGDTILVFPGSYTENIIVTKDYITIKGAQFGYAKPDVVPSSGVALTINNAQGFRSFNMRYAAPAADVDLIVQEGNGFAYIGNVLDGDATQGNAKALLRLEGDDSDDSYTASEGVIEGNLFRASGGVGIAIRPGEPPSNGVGSTDLDIRRNVFQANDQCDIATEDSTVAGVFSIQASRIGPDNIFMDKAASCYIDLTTANGGAASDQTGLIIGNYFAIDDVSTTEVKMVGTGFHFVGNYDGGGIEDGTGLD